MTIDGRRRRITKREAIVAQMVDKSASADLRATKILLDMIKDVEHKVGDAAPPPEPRRLAAADQEVVQQFVARLRRSCKRSKKPRRQRRLSFDPTNNGSPGPQRQQLGAPSESPMIDVLEH